jgi:hypothetical protein
MVFFPEAPMMVPKMAGPTLLFLAFACVKPLGAQVLPNYRWTPDRPDAQGPVGLSETRTLGAGEVQVNIKYFHFQSRGQGAGRDSLTLNQVLRSFDVAPHEMLTQGVAVDLLFGVNRHLTVAASGTFARKTMDNLAGLDGQSNLFLFYKTEASGLQDVKVNALYNVFDRGAMRVHVHGGVSIPVGAIDADAVTPFSEPAPAQLPYTLQLGSGTFDLLPGATLVIQNEKASLGVQTRGTIRLGENDRGWRLGDTFEGTVWAGFHNSQWISTSLGGRFSSWGNVEGFDAGLNPNESPAHNTLTQGGWRVDLPVGINIVVPPGRFGGNRFGLEFTIPLHQDLDGPQLRHRWSLVAGWQKSISF